MSRRGCRSLCQGKHVNIVSSINYAKIVASVEDIAHSSSGRALYISPSLLFSHINGCTMSSTLVTFVMWIYNYLCNQSLPPLKLYVRIPRMARCTRYNFM